MYVRRGKLEQEMEILKSAQTPNLPTRMMYAANMSWKPVKKMIKNLVKRGLLKGITWDEYNARPDTPQREEKSYKSVNGTSLDHRTKLWYVVTEKGKAVLDLQNKIIDLTNAPAES
jgi:predicted transcriptional regulator